MASDRGDRFIKQRIVNVDKHLECPDYIEFPTEVEHGELRAMDELRSFIGELTFDQLLVCLVKDLATDLNARIMPLFKECYERDSTA